MSEKGIEKAMQDHLDNLTKPRGSLGKLEEFCMKMAKIQGKAPPRIDKKGIYVFAGDHGITEEGVSLYPQEVTLQMTLNFLTGGAGINALAGGTGWELTAVDAGVAGEFPPGFPPEPTPEERLKPERRFIRASLGRGSRNFYKEPALTPEELHKTLDAGKDLARDARERGCQLTAIGDMGIGNTSTAAAMLIAAGFPAEAMVDRGTGIDEKMLDHKRKILEESVARRKPAAGFSEDGMAIMERLGSFDLAMMTGFILGLKGQGIGCVLDGFPVTSAAYMAFLIDRSVTDYLFAGHLSKVVGHKPVLDALGLAPIVSLDMRLGEGTGAVVGGFIIDLAVQTAWNMSSFAEAGIAASEQEEENY